MPLSKINTNSIANTASPTITRIGVGVDANTTYGIINRYFGNSEIATQYGTGTLTGIGAYSATGGVFMDTAGGKIYPMQWNTSGQINRPYQPAFHISGNSRTVRSSGEYSVVEGGSGISTNVGSCWNNTTKRFVVPIAGIYHFVMTVTGNGSGFNAGMSIRKNGIEHNYQLNYNGYYQSGTCSTILECAVSDYVEAFVVWNNGVSGSIYNGSFTGFLL